MKIQQGLEPLFSIFDVLRLDTERRYWIERLQTSEVNRVIEGEMGQMSTAVKIAFSVSHGFHKVA